ncbi:hypothetical protein C8R47DRAFT_1083863 [Mycena vitilis]|nr:hypothetical protein C8R47DRAFT_1083863 [Mycena vitilis]
MNINKKTWLMSRELRRVLPDINIVRPVLRNKMAAGWPLSELDRNVEELRDKAADSERSGTAPRCKARRRPRHVADVYPGSSKDKAADDPGSANALAGAASKAGHSTQTRVLPTALGIRSFLLLCCHHLFLLPTFLASLSTQRTPQILWGASPHSISAPATLLAAHKARFGSHKSSCTCAALRIVESFANGSSMQSAAAAYQKTVHPDKREGDGTVYLQANVDNEDLCLWRAGLINDDALIAPTALKAGFTNCLPRRQREYRKCEQGERTIVWMAAYHVARRCFVDSIRGLAAVDSRVVDVLLASGEQMDRETLPRPDIDGDFYDLILHS